MQVFCGGRIHNSPQNEHRGGGLSVASMSLALEPGLECGAGVVGDLPIL